MRFDWMVPWIQAYSPSHGLWYMVSSPNVGENSATRQKRFFLALTQCPHSIYFEEDSSMEASTGLTLGTRN